MSNKVKKIKENILKTKQDYDYLATGTLMGSIIRTVAILADKSVDEEMELFDKLEEEMIRSAGEVSWTIKGLFDYVCIQFNYTVPEEFRNNIVLLNNGRNTPLVTIEVDGNFAPLTIDGTAFGLIAKANAEKQLLGYVETVNVEHFLESEDEKKVQS